MSARPVVIPVPSRSSEPAAGPAPVARGALWLAGNGLVVKGAQTAVLLTLAAVLAPAALGLLAVGSLVANLAAAATTAGTAGSLVYWRGDAERAARTALTLGLTTGAVLAALGWWLAPVLAGRLGVAGVGAPGDAVLVLRGLTLTLPCVAVAAVTAELLRRRLRFARRVLPDAVAATVGAVVAVVLVLHGAGVAAFVAGQVVQALVSVLVAWCVHPPVAPGWRSDDARALLRFGLPVTGAQLLEMAQLNLDYVVVSVALGATALGQYSLAFRVGFAPYLMIAVMVAGAAFPALCRLPADRLGPAAGRVLASTLAGVLPVCAALVVLAGQVTLLGAAWAPAVPVLAVLAVYAAVASVVEVGQVTLLAAGRPTTALALRAGHVLVLVVVLVAVVRHGIVAVAAAQVAVGAAAAVVTLLAVRRWVPGLALVSVAARLRVPLLGSAALAATTAAVLWFSGAIGPAALPSWGGSLLAGCAGLATYLGVCAGLGRRHGRDTAAGLGPGSAAVRSDPS